MAELWWTILLLVLFSKHDCCAMTSTCSKKSALVTGSTDGIGLTTAKNLAAKGYNVIVHGRNEAKIQAAAQTVQKFASEKTGGDGVSVYSINADLSTIRGSETLASQVKSLCENHDLELSVLMNNAGAFTTDRKITSDGHELTFAVNVISPFILTSHLLPLLLRQKSRIVITSSIAQSRSIQDWKDLTYSRRTYNGYESYGESKLLDAMMTMEFADRLQNAGLGTDRITCNCLHPGVVNTNMLQAGWGSGGISVDSALDQTWLCTDEELENTTGKFYVRRQESWTQYSAGERKKMWDTLADIAPDAAAMWDFKWM